MPTRFIDAELLLLKASGSVCNVILLYKMLKKFHQLRLIVSFTRFSSRLVGYICKVYTPVCLRKPLFGTFGKVYGVKIEEAQRDKYEMYRNFTDFFTRTLKSGVRPITNPNCTQTVCSPCDGRVLTIGTVNGADSTIDCVKGRSYRLDEFLLGYRGNPTDPSESHVRLSSYKNNHSV